MMNVVFGIVFCLIIRSLVQEYKFDFKNNQIFYILPTKRLIIPTFLIICNFNQKRNSSLNGDVIERLIIQYRQCTSTMMYILT